MPLNGKLNFWLKVYLYRKLKAVSIFSVFYVHYILEWPRDFQFSSNGPLSSEEYRCTQISQPNPSTPWNSTYFCAKRIGTNPRLRWLFQKPRERLLANRQCISINQSSWENNFLCVSKEIGLLFTWSYFGHPRGMKCLKMEAESLGWENNYLCRSSKHGEDNQTMVRTYE